MSGVSGPRSATIAPHAAPQRSAASRLFSVGKATLIEGDIRVFIRNIELSRRVVRELLLYITQLNGATCTEMLVRHIECLLSKALVALPVFSVRA